MMRSEDEHKHQMLSHGVYSTGPEMVGGVLDAIQAQSKILLEIHALLAELVQIEENR